MFKKVIFVALSLFLPLQIISDDVKIEKKTELESIKALIQGFSRNLPHFESERKTFNKKNNINISNEEVVTYLVKQLCQPYYIKTCIQDFINYTIKICIQELHLLHTSNGKKYKKEEIKIINKFISLILKQNNFKEITIESIKENIEKVCGTIIINLLKNYPECISEVIEATIKKIKNINDKTIKILLYNSSGQDRIKLENAIKSTPEKKELYNKLNKKLSWWKKQKIYLSINILKKLYAYETKPHPHPYPYSYYTYSYDPLSYSLEEIYKLSKYHFTKLKRKFANFLIPKTKNAIYNNLLILQSKEVIKIKKSLKNNTTETYFSSFLDIKTKYLKKLFPNYLTYIPKPKTQSEWHIKKNKTIIKNNFYNKNKNNKNLQKMLLKLNEQEQKESKKGNYTFIHAQQWKWHFTSDIFKKLWEIKYSEKINNYQFLRFEPKCTNLQLEKQKRINALNDTDDHTYHNTETANRLFINHAIFGNESNNGSSSLYYWLNNSDCSSSSFSIKELFEILDLSKYYSKYKKEFNKLKKLHKKSSNYGNLLLISCTSNMVSKCIMPTDGCGTRELIKINEEDTYDTKKIIDTLKKQPKQINDSNFIQYCMILTHDCALDPQNGPQIYNFHAANKKIFKEYEKLRDKIFTDIKKDITNKKSISKIKFLLILKKILQIKNQ